MNWLTGCFTIKNKTMKFQIKYYIFVMLVNNAYAVNLLHHLKYTSRAVAISLPVSVVDKPSARAGFFIMETWSQIHGFDTLYEVSNTGKVRYEYSKLEIPYSKTKQGYITVSFLKFHHPKRFKVHRLVAIAFIPNPENKPQVNHKDGKKDNNNEWNLEWATAKENIHHAMANGLFVYNGYKNRKFDNEIASEIKRLKIETGVGNGALALKYKCDKNTIRGIINGVYYKDVV